MPVSLDDCEELAGADVFDAKGELIGTLREPHVLDGELVGVIVDLDEEIAVLPTVARDEVEIAPDYMRRDGEIGFRVDMELMDAVTGHAPRKSAPREGA